MSKTKNKLNEALALMPNQFTTHKLNEAIQELGGKILPTHVLHFELSGKAKRITKYQWSKLNAETELFSHEEKVLECIEYLKEHGYKVMKPVTDYIEL